MSFIITAEPVGYLLNINVVCHDNGSIEVNQESYAKDIVRPFNMTEANPVSTPTEQYLQPNELTSDNVTNAPYQEAVGCLMYLAVGTRPNIAFAVSYMSKVLENLREYHCSVVKRILNYIKGSVPWGLKYAASHGNRRLEIYTADYASDPATQRSVIGVVARSCGRALTWDSRQQH
ncbi:secreted RxLR effector protein 161-like [Schistocerca piceifrons]|uniref:secreted RxLR effector protein 161-like n=1 Tax=Schistocerca piceifrons TaxID=274613 RepID=UPI001F5EDF99|nr:secreted RxLR effector protein 161-like [Schistocerca piceifrons]